MRSIPGKVLLLACLLLMLPPAAPADSLIHRLDNGLTLIVADTPGSPAATVSLWIRHGSADETPGREGTAHFLEHMMFKGSTARSRAEIDGAIKRMGGFSNGATSLDFTYYYISAPAGKIGGAMELLAESLLTPRLDPVDLDGERQVVIEEIRRKADDPVGSLFETCISDIFRGTPYGSPVLGSISSLRATDMGTLRDYYGRFYRPGEMAIIVTGGVNPESILADARRCFGALPRAVTPAPAGDKPWQLLPGRGLTLARPVKKAYILLAAPAPGYAEQMKFDDICALDLLTVALGQGRSSRLYRRLREGTGMVTDIGAFNSTWKRAGLLAVYAVTERDRLKDVEKEIRSILKDAADITPEELEKARAMVRRDYIFSHESSAEAVSSYGMDWIMGSEEGHQGYLKRIGSIDLEIVRKAASTWLKPGLFSVYIVLPEESKS